MESPPYHLEVLDKPYCTNQLLEIFSRAHMSYINQIFGDETIRSIIKEVYGKKGKLVVLPAGPEFENSIHHVYYYDSDEEVEVPVFDRNDPTGNVSAATSPRTIPTTVGGASVTEPILNASKSNINIVKNVMNNMVTKVEGEGEGEAENEDEFYMYSSKVCSVDYGYQDLEADVNDTLCQSYSLMALLDIDFDSTPSKIATREQKYNKHLAMINMYRKILNNKKFQKEFGKIIKDEDNNELWEDVVNDNNIFFIIKKYKKPIIVINKIREVLDVWEKWGWQFFVGDGKCAKIKTEGGKRKTRRKH